MEPFLFGLCLGAVIGAHLAWWRFTRYTAPTFELKVTDDVLKRLDAATVAQWCNKHQMVVMPKGKEFTWSWEVKNG